MTNNTYFGYLRVSTPRQSLEGVSIQEQERVIRDYAEEHGLAISRWLREVRSAAYRGRPVFKDMLEGLRAGQAQGVILHRIDRGARNLRDWADLMELVEDGVEVHLAGDGLDLRSRGGRLVADMQAVVASDFIRNLRDEAKKGIEGRLRQGLWPFPAPMGYLDTGKGKVKVPDGEQAKLLREAFELYARGDYTLRALAKEMATRGLRTKLGTPVRPGPLGETLRNPWYYGVMTLASTKQTFPGRHLPLVSKELFDRVQILLTGRYRRKHTKNRLLFQRLLKCASCGYTLVGERQKGHVYYRCHSAGCKGQQSLREDRLETQLRNELAKRSPATLSDYDNSTAEGKRAIIETARASGSGLMCIPVPYLQAMHCHS